MTDGYFYCILREESENMMPMDIKPIKTPLELFCALLLTSVSMIVSYIMKQEEKITN